MAGSHALITEPHPVSPSTSSTPYPVEPGQVAILSWYGVVMAYAIQLAYRCVIRKIDAEHTWVRVCKLSLGISFFIKGVLFSVLGTNLISDCIAVIRAADFFFHFGMLSGNAVLLLRVRAIFPHEWNTASKIFHIMIIVVRLGIGVVDISMLSYVRGPRGMCRYQESAYWGPVYTFYDTLVDAYVTVMIGYMLSKHVSRLRRSFVEVNTSTYIVFLAQNVIRTTVLTGVNLLSALFILMREGHYAIMVLWPVINSLVLLLIGYDVDLTRVVQDMRLMLLNRRVSHSEVDDVEYGESIDRDGDHRSLRSARPQTIQGEPKIRVPPRCKLCGSRIDPNGYAASGPPMSNYASSAPCSPHHTPSSFLSDPSGISAILGSEYSSHSLCDSPYDELQRFDFSPTSTLPTPELERISESYDRTAPPMYIPPPFKQYASYSPSPDNNNNRRKSYPPRRRSI
ncbi:hypothetical protein RO3G_02504 [Lichtheimia corymbifera JMRC:FSU:9682]|uniref:Uncharacterized protein n=1 Tax=Lichtheimia corymbifera JMRC:FSU:9682 TaxID=1263082 RepID=A0A068S537_9FUNG|nr:hypothetical protein RO3G_02504 [Lichtheimia corymbifera JMRC:FSU:9682]